MYIDALAPSIPMKHGGFDQIGFESLLFSL